ncbi:RteC domain-containing protein [Capnocytophaga leadbetteri]|uniref:RteC domain-containing protein n=1 Tax=Capnocytophaga leadbetteri TaxID=327575 RepID=UPI000D30A42D
MSRNSPIIFFFRTEVKEEKLLLEALNLQWTGKKSQLVELIYGLHSVGCISYGKLPISQITKVFEKLFKVELAEQYHVFHRMKGRSKSLTPFLDEVKASLLVYINNSNQK